MRWLDDGRYDPEEDGRGKQHGFSAVVASRADLVEDYSHIRALGEAISGSKVRALGLSDCELGPAALVTFVQSVRWETAALTEVDVRYNMVDEAVLEQLRAAAPETCKILSEGQQAQVTRSSRSERDTRGGGGGGWLCCASPASS